MQSDTIKIVKNLYNSTQLLIYSMIIQELDMKSFTKQNKMKQMKNSQEQDLKY